MMLALVLWGLVPGALAQQEGCFGAGSVAGAAVGAFLGAVFLVLAAYYLRKLYWKSRKGNSGVNVATGTGKHLVFTTDPESVKDEFAFDNPGFRHEERAAAAAAGAAVAAGWQHDAATLPLGASAGKREPPREHELRRSKDDLHLEGSSTVLKMLASCRAKLSTRANDIAHYTTKPQIRRVQLWARDFTGLGFRAEGGAREGVRVHSVLRAGPAAAASLQPGDKIRSVKISLVGCVLEDAVQLLSLASPYPVELEVEGGAGWARRAGGRACDVRHPLLRAGSTGDVTALEKEGRLLHPPRSPDISNSNNSTLETKSKGGIKKIITEKIITTTTLERAKKDKEKRESSTLERENEKNVKLANKNRYSDSHVSKPERNKTRHSTESEVQIIQPENGIVPMERVEKAETQKREYDPKRGMKFGIRVLPPNVPDDGVIRQKSNENGDIHVEKKAIDEPDKGFGKPVEIRVENEINENKTKPIVAKRRERAAPPVPNARNLNRQSETDIGSQNNSKASEQSVTSSFLRDDLNSSGIRRDENGIPQELPQHMLEAAMMARSNRKSVPDYSDDYKHIETRRDSDFGKLSKKTKGKAPSPPEYEKDKSDHKIIEQLKNVDQFLNSEKLHSSVLHDFSGLAFNEPKNSYNTSTPKINKFQHSNVDDSINFSQDDIDDIVSKPFKRESDSLNNYYEDSKSNLSSNLDVHSVVSLNNSDKGSTTIELNNSDITIHSSPTNDTLQSISDEASILDENERKATSLGDLSRFENRGNKKPSQGTLERAQSLDISADDAEGTEKVISPKRKAKSVVEATFYDSSNVENIPDMIDAETIVIKSKQPRLSLNLAKTTAMEGLSTFQRNRLKKGSEFGNLEDAIVKGSNSSLDSDKEYTDQSHKHNDYGIDIHEYESGISKFGQKLETEVDESSDHFAKRIMDENMKVHFKLVSEFAKSTSDGSSLNSLEHEPRSDVLYSAKPVNTELPSSLSITYDTNIPDDMKVSRHTLVNSLERPKSDMMKKLLAKNPALNVHVDQSKPDLEEITQESKNYIKSSIDSEKVRTLQPDVVNINLKNAERKLDEIDDFVSNIKIGSNNNSLSYDKKHIYESNPTWTESPKIEKQNNIVTINTERSSPTENNNKKEHYNLKGFTKSIEIGENKKQIPDVIEGVSRGKKMNQTNNNNDQMTVSSRTYFSENPTHHIDVSSIEEPVQKTVTVNVAEDEFGNQIITQNVEEISTQYITSKTEAPLQIEQISFGLIKNPKEIEKMAMEEGDNIKQIDEKILQEIKKQNPNLHFTTDEPAYSKTETIILNTNLEEAEALALMEKLKNDSSFMSERSSEELSQMGIRVIHDLEDGNNKTDDHVEVTKTRYSINPAKMSTISGKCSEDEDKIDKEKLRSSPAEVNKTSEQISQANNNHITEIQVMTPRTENLHKQKSRAQTSDEQAKPRSSSYSEPPLSYELDISLLNDFISNERRHSAKDLADIHPQQHYKVKSQIKETIEEKSHHSDFDLPRNTQIKFRTATYESPKGTIVTSTDLENKRLSQMDQLRSNFENESRSARPVISVKPSNIPVKMQDKPKPLVSPSKIPVFTSQKSQSQENLSDKSLSLARASPPKLSASSGNITITSIKSSSRNPSGK